MNSKKIIEPIFNSALEILPLILFAIAMFYIPIGTAFLIGAIACIICFVLAYCLFHYTPPYMLIVSSFVMVLYSLISIIPPLNSIYHEFLPIICEVLLVITLSIIRTLKGYIIQKIKGRQNKPRQAIATVKLDEFFYVSKMIRNILIAHLLIVLLYELLPSACHSVSKDRIIIPGLLFTFIMLFIIFESVRLSILNRKIRSEDWLPIVNETGSVIGKVASSVSFSSGKSYLHPLIRIALIHKGMLYLWEHPANHPTEPNKIDYPFEKLVLYNQPLEGTIKSILEEVCGNSDLPVKFVFRYLYKSNVSNRLVYLYTCRISDENLMNTLNLKNGKLWMEKQIEENLDKGIFTECFEKEYEILKNTVLQVEKIMQ